MSHLATCLINIILAPLRRAAFEAMRAAAVRKRVEGIEIIDPLVGEQQPSRIPKVAEAIHLIGSRRPIFLRRIRRNLRGVVINNSRTGYLENRRICILNDISVDRQDPEEIALDLVHEVTHAVLHRAGFRYEGHMRARLERACVKAEIRMAQFFPGGPALAERTAAKLDEVWWTDDDLREGRDADLRAASVPDCIIRLRRLGGE